MKNLKRSLFLLGLFLAIWLAWYLSIPGPDQRRWETYCYPDGARAQVVEIAQLGGYDLRVLQMRDGQPGWWYLRGDAYSPEKSCLLLHYWYQFDIDGDGLKDQGWPFAEYIPTGADHCCTMGGF